MPSNILESFFLSLMPSEVLGVILILHISADFMLQGVFGNLKRKDRREKNYPDALYKQDYRVALLLHSLNWALIVCIPLVAVHGAYLYTAIMMAAGHYILDNAKVNRKELSLLWGQLFHMGQLVCIWGQYIIFSR